MISFAMCGSFCTHAASLEVLRELCRNEDVLPIVSNTVYETDTRFGTAAKLKLLLEETTGRRVIHTVTDAELLGPDQSSECLIICPTTGNTLTKLALGITDSSVTMAAKAHLRTDRPVILAIAPNDALGASLESISKLLNRKNFYIVPMLQDDTVKKPHSLVADFSRVKDALDAARQGKQLRPVFLTK